MCIASAGAALYTIVADPTSNLDYARPDEATLAPDERVAWEHVHAPPRGTRESATTAALCLGLSAFVVACVAWRLPPGGRAIAVLVLGGVGVVVSAIVVRDRSRAAAPPTLFRLTRLRLLRRREGDKAESVDLADVHEVTVMFDKKPAATLSVRRAAMEEDPLSIAIDDLGMRPAFGVDVLVRLARDVAGLSLDRRRERRAARRRWRPLAEADTPAIAMAQDEIAFDDAAPPTLMDGERVLWSGRPSLRLGADARAWARGVARSSPWIAGAAAAIALWAIAPGSATFEGVRFLLGGAAIVGGIILVGQFLGHVVGPLNHRPRLKKTSYTLTDRRLIVRARTGARSATEQSLLFDDATAVALDDRGDGVGTIDFGGIGKVERVPDARAVYDLALRAVAGARMGEAAVALPAEPPAV